MHLSAMREYARNRGWEVAVEVKDVGSGAALRQKREELIAAAKRRDIDLVCGLAARPLGTLLSGPGEHAAGTVVSQGRFRIAE